MSNALQKKHFVEGMIDENNVLIPFCFFNSNYFTFVLIIADVW